MNEVVDAQLTSETDPQNKAVAVVLHQNGIDRSARTAARGEPVVPTVVAVDPAVLERYVGEYQLVPGLVITVTRQDVHLRPAHRPAGIRGVRIGRDFFYKVVNAQLTFEVGATGPAVAVVLHQNGQYPRAPRIVR